MPKFLMSSEICILLQNPLLEAIMQQVIYLSVILELDKDKICHLCFLHCT